MGLTNGWTAQKLIKFEKDIEREFLEGNIRAPVHFSEGNESQLIEIFRNIKNTDWVFSTHRNHLHALLHGISQDWLKEQILSGRSMHINSKERKFVTSSIVNGCVPIAVGVAMALKRQSSEDKVWCFVGDMAESVGIFYENSKYARNFNLPIYFIIECNDLSTNTPTSICWGEEHAHQEGITLDSWGNGGIYQYCYIRGCAHINVKGKFVVFK